MYSVKESGRNGTIEIANGKIVRTIKGGKLSPMALLNPLQLLGRSDSETIPARAIQSVKLDRNIGRADSVVLSTASRTYEWKIGGNQAKQLVDEIDALI